MVAVPMQDLSSNGDSIICRLTLNRDITELDDVSHDLDNTTRRLWVSMALVAVRQQRPVSSHQRPAMFA